MDQAPKASITNAEDESNVNNVFIYLAKSWRMLFHLFGNYFCEVLLNDKTNNLWL